MKKFASVNQSIHSGYLTVDEENPQKRDFIYPAVKHQIESDGKGPWSLGQKLKDSPYRYGRDELSVSCQSIARKLSALHRPIIFGVEKEFSSPDYASFAEFVNKSLGKTVSDLINAIVNASRWSDQ